MAIKITTTKEASKLQGLKMVVFGHSGAGKTHLCSTCPDLGRTLIVSAEAGMLTLRDHDIDVVEISSIEDMQEVYMYLRKEGAEKYDWVCIDSLSEIAEKVLAVEKDANRNGMKAYGDMADRMFKVIRAYRDLKGVNILFTAKCERIQDDERGGFVYVPMLPGKRLSNNLAYFFDFVLYLDSYRNEEGEIDRRLLTAYDGRHDAKDRSGALDEYEAPSIAAIAEKINNSIKG